MPMMTRNSLEKRSSSAKKSNTIKKIMSIDKNKRKKYVLVGAKKKKPIRDERRGAKKGDDHWRRKNIKDRDE